MKKIIIALAMLISNVIGTDEVKQLDPHKVKWSADMFKYVGSKYINCDVFSDTFREALARGYNTELDKDTAFSVFYVSDLKAYVTYTWRIDNETAEIFEVFYTNSRDLCPVLLIQEGWIK